MEQNTYLAEHNKTHAIQLLTYKGKNHLEVIEELKARGMDEEDASVMVLDLIKQLREEKRQQSQNDMLYGALWCLGGITLTYISEGVFIFYGAILFGGYQFFKGMFN